MAEIHNPITGGCLCGEIRYTLSFPAGSKWPPGPHTCQCTQCRKNTGALVVHFLTLPSSQVGWALPKSRSGPSDAAANPTTAFREYVSSPGCYRGFCERCGTTLTWRTERCPTEIEIMLGTVDEDCIKEKDLCLPTGGQYWCRNFIAGVTDNLPATGPKWVEGSRLGEKLE